MSLAYANAEDLARRMAHIAIPASGGPIFRRSRDYAHPAQVRSQDVADKSKPGRICAPGE